MTAIITLTLINSFGVLAFAQSEGFQHINTGILKHLERSYVVDLGLSELSEENRSVFLNISPEDLLVTLKVDEGTEYITQEKLDAINTENAHETKPPIFEINETVAVLKYSEFNFFTTQETRNFFASPQTSKINLTGVIIDLRNNVGGLFDEITKLAGLFLEDDLIFSMVARDPTDTEHFYADNKDVIWGKPIIILTDDSTASGAAIFVKALQSNGRAKVYGQPSSDIGYIQSLIPLRYGRQGVLKISTHKIMFADGDNASGSRVMPDQYVQEDVLEKAVQSLRSGDLK